MQSQSFTESVDHADWAFSIDPNAYPVTLWARTRRLLASGVRMGTINGDTGKIHGPERPEILSFIATVEVRYNGAWVPEANGSSIWWLQRELDSAAQCYRRVRVVAPWGEEITLR